MKYFIEAITKWKDFSGRTGLKEFWIFFLIFSLMGIPIGFIQSWTNFEHLNMVYLILMIVPYMAIGFRRLNDAGINRFLFLIPFIGLVLAVFPSKEKNYIE
jgi:uncharacterized membrane protein YhaH (DUF805 family)